jgi:MFS family permease
MLGYVETTSITRTVFVSDDYAYVANTAELLIVDVSMPALPDVRGSYSFEGGPIVTPIKLLETLEIILIITSIIGGIALITFLAKLGQFIRMTKSWKEDTGSFTNSLGISLFLAISGLFLWLSYNAFVNYNEPLMNGMLFTSSLLGGLVCGIFVYKKDWAAVTLPLALVLGICDFCILLLLYNKIFVQSFFTSIGILLTVLISSAIGRVINQAIKDEKKEKPAIQTAGEIKCSECNESIPSSSKFCYNCGFVIEN